MPFSLATLLSFQSTFHTVWVWEVLVYYFLMDIYEEINKYELKSNRIIIRDENGNIVKSCNNPSGDIGDWEWV